MALGVAGSNPVRRPLKIAVVGATGLVGRKILEVLEERLWKESPEVIPIASNRSEGKEVEFLGKSLEVVPIDYGIPKVDFAIFSAGSHVAKTYASIFVEKGAVVIDNSSAFRLEPNVPLVVPEVNPEDAFKHKGIISNPNCSTIQMVIFLKPLLSAFGISDVFVATYQAVSGAGMKGLISLNEEEMGRIFDETPFPTRIYRNVIPQIGEFSDGYSTEEWKMIKETKKILKEDVKVYPTTVRVPVEVGHSEAITVILKSSPSLSDIYEVLEKQRGLKVLRDGYVTPIDAEDKDLVFVSRIRFSTENPRALSAWVVADNLRKGAATNAVQILQLLIGGLE